MEIGCCCAIEKEPLAREAGFDYVECTVVSLSPDKEDADFTPILARYGASTLPARAFNVFLPRDLKIVGPTIQEERLANYLNRALGRVRRLGGEVVVFGSGGARSIPEGFPRDEAVDQIVRFLHLVADVTDHTNLMIAIEPLNRRESNVINSVAEAVDLAIRVDRPSIRVLADFYHMDEENEPIDHLVRFRDWIIHIHVADTGRLAPGTGQYPYESFAAALQQAEYKGRVSIECRWGDFLAEAPAALQFLRHTFSDAHTQ
jgi:sugar phosphate isomerase/epimerase